MTKNVKLLFHGFAVYYFKQVKQYNTEQQCCSVSASFGFVLRSPNGSETKPVGEPALLKFYTTNIEIGGTKLLVITELKY